MTNIYLGQGKKAAKKVRAFVEQRELVVALILILAFIVTSAPVLNNKTSYTVVSPEGSWPRYIKSKG